MGWPELINAYKVILKLVPQTNTKLRVRKQGQSKANQSTAEKSSEQIWKLNDVTELLTSEICSA